MTSYRPYNITIADCEPLFQYSPSRDGPSNSSWNVPLYSGAIQHYTASSPGASVQLIWTGTAVWIYGIGNTSDYEVRSDSDPTPTRVLKSADDTILYSQGGLLYGKHRVNIDVTGGSVTIISATTTVGMGDPNTYLENRTIAAAISSSSGETALNPMFSPSDDNQWSIPVSSSAITAAYLETSARYASIFFQVNSSVAFELYGVIGSEHGAYSVALDPPAPNTGIGVVTEYNASYPVTTTGSVLYIATGLNRLQTYNVTITNLDAAKLSLESVVIYDSSVTSTSSSIASAQFTAHASQNSTSSSSVEHSNHKTLAIVASTVGGLLLIGAVACYCYYRIRRSGTQSRAHVDLGTPPPTATTVYDGAFPPLADPYMKAYEPLGGSQPPASSPSIGSSVSRTRPLAAEGSSSSVQDPSDRSYPPLMQRGRRTRHDSIQEEEAADSIPITPPPGYTFSVRFANLGPTRPSSVIGNMKSQSLNEDIWFHIIYLVTPADALSLSAVCKEARPFARRRSLSEIHLHSRNFDKICNFLLADISDRLHWVRDLTLAVDIFEPEASLSLYQFDLEAGGNVKFEWVPVFLKILQLSDNLRRLSIYGTELLLRMEPAIGDALVALTGLTSLELNYAGSHTIRTLARLQSTVRHLIVHHVKAGNTVRNYHEYMTHGVTFSGVETIEFGDLVSESYPHTKNVYLDRQWPNVRHLTLSQGCLISLSTCARLLPGIRSLHLKSAPGYDPHGLPLWPNLDFVWIQCRDLHYITEINCPVHFLKLRDDTGLRYEFPPRILKIIKTPSPVVLSIMVHIPLNTMLFWIALLQSAPRLRCLDFIVIYDDTGKDRLCKWIEDISDVFASSRLLCIRIRIHDRFCKLSDIHFLLPSLEHFARGVRSLQYLAFGLGNIDTLSKARPGRFCGKTWWWWVTTCEESRSIEAISRESGKHILAAIRSADFGDGKNLDGLSRLVFLRLVSARRGKEVEAVSDNYYANEHDMSGVIHTRSIV
ncbi:hypothetical protein IEO21_07558 [Rhodonia placenta]|uniref:F-box domain-containing protein n=1 Tax=Rhodonia placenta TaxID=104341 RepID=A0A8H7U087_9APHY|nr:hypothetical protein IEO21_07558 [Postia placenta]